MNLVEKIISDHLKEGKLEKGKEIGIKIDQTLTQDATGTMAYLQFEAMNIDKVRTEKSVSYIDHNTLQAGFENADDHRFLRTIALKYGINFSRPGNGICHQVHLERFANPGKTLLGSDSHTPTAGGMGMLAIGAGGLDVAAAMAGAPFYLNMPKVVNIKLKNKLTGWATAKDIILKVLEILSVKGGVGKIIEYTGEGVASLSVPERATITNMGAELGATTSIFPSDERTLAFLKAQNRADAFIELKPDEDAQYDETIEIDLSEIEPLLACPHSPDNIKTAKELKGTKVEQVCIGSCTNSSYIDMVTAARMLKGKKIHPDVSLTVSPGSKQVLEMIAREGYLADLIKSGARIIESACGPCIGMGQAPPSKSNTVRSFNRNFKGRSGTIDAGAYLAGIPVCITAALTGEINHPQVTGDAIRVEMPTKFIIDNNMIIEPIEDRDKVEIVRGPNIKPCPTKGEIEDEIEKEVLLKVEDNITTDHIMPAGAKVLPYRSNIPKISEFVYYQVDENFSIRAKEKQGGYIVGGENYGQGSSREHAALAPMYLGIKAVIAKSFARIHYQNLINFGILPLVFSNPEDYDKIVQGDVIVLSGIRNILETGKEEIEALVKNKDIKIKCRLNLSERHRKVLILGGYLNYVKDMVK